MTMNALERLVELVAEMAEQDSCLGPVNIEISLSIGIDLIAMNVDTWRSGSRGSLSDQYIDELMSRFFKDGVSGLNGLVVRGIRISVSSDPGFSGVRIIGAGSAL